MKRKCRISNLIRPALMMILAVAVLATLVSCGNKPEAEPESALDEQAESIHSDEYCNDLIMTAIKVGAADAFVLQYHNHTVVIDTATDKKADKVVTYLTENNIKRIDDLIITHFDKDHVGGADKLIKAFEIGNVYTTYRSKDSDDIAEYDAAMKECGLTEIVVTSEITCEVEGMSFTIYPPQAQSYQEKESNNSSLVVKVTYGDNSILFAGDAESERLSELLNTPNLSCTILKVPHHGRYCDKTEAFINYVSPSYAIITSSKGEPEDEKTISALDSVGATTFLTRNGSIVFTITKDSITYTQ